MASLPSLRHGRCWLALSPPCSASCGSAAAGLPVPVGRGGASSCPSNGTAPGKATRLVILEELGLLGLTLSLCFKSCFNGNMGDRES